MFWFFLTLLLFFSESRPGSTTSMGSRHESELMEQLRKVEESAARDKWRNIVQFCKEVNTHFVKKNYVKRRFTVKIHFKLNFFLVKIPL